MRKSVFLIVTGLIIGMMPVAGFCRVEAGVGFPVVVDYDQTIEKMAGAGNYDFVCPDINSKNFSISRTGQVRAYMYKVCFDQQRESGVRIPMRSEDVIYELKEMGLRPATLPELLAFGVQHLKAVDDQPIVALGSRSPHPNDYYSDVAYICLALRANGITLQQIINEAQQEGFAREDVIEVLLEEGHAEWRLGLSWYELNWLGYECFLAVGRETVIHPQPELEPKPYTPR